MSFSCPSSVGIVPVKFVFPISLNDELERVDVVTYSPTRLESLPNWVGIAPLKGFSVMNS